MCVPVCVWTCVCVRVHECVCARVLPCSLAKAIRSWWSCCVGLLRKMSQEPCGMFIFLEKVFSSISRSLSPLSMRNSSCETHTRHKPSLKSHCPELVKRRNTVMCVFNNYQGFIYCHQKHVGISNYKLNIS